MQINKFLKEQLKSKKGLSPLLNSFALRYLDSEKFQEEFGEMTPEEMAEFIVNIDNAYEIGKWSERQRNPICSKQGTYKAKNNIVRDNGDRFED